MSHRNNTRSIWAPFVQPPTCRHNRPRRIFPHNTDEQIFQRRGRMRDLCRAGANLVQELLELGNLSRWSAPWPAHLGDVFDLEQVFDFAEGLHFPAEKNHVIRSQ